MKQVTTVKQAIINDIILGEQVMFNDENVIVFDGELFTQSTFYALTDNDLNCVYCVTY